MAVLAPPVQVVASGAPPFVHVPSGAPPFVAVSAYAPPITIVDSGAPPITLFNEDGSLWAGGGWPVAPFLEYRPSEGDAALGAMPRHGSTVPVTDSEILHLVKGTGVYLSAGGATATYASNVGPEGQTTAHRIVSTGGGQNGILQLADNITLPAGTYTFFWDIRTSPGATATQTLRGGPTVAMADITATTSWQTVAVTVSPSSTTVYAFWITRNNASEGAFDVLIDNIRIVKGATVLPPPVVDGHVLFGLSQFDPANPTFAGGVIAQGTVAGIIELAAAKTFTELTFLFAGRHLTTATGGMPVLSAADYQNFYAGIGTGGLGGGGIQFRAVGDPTAPAVPYTYSKDKGWMTLGVRIKDGKQELLVNGAVYLDSQLVAPFPGFTNKFMEMFGFGGISTITGYPGDLGPIVLFDKYLNDTQLAAADRYLRFVARGTSGITFAQEMLTLFGNGDSITNQNSFVGATGGVGSHIHRIFKARPTQLTGTVPSTVGSAISGVIDHLTNWQLASMKYLVDQGQTVIMSPLIGANDSPIISDPTGWYNQLITQVYRPARAVGAKILAQTVLPRENVGAAIGFNAGRAIVNNLLRAHLEEWDGLADYDTKPVGADGAPAARVLYVDGTHPNGLGYDDMEFVEAAALDALIARLTVPPVNTVAPVASGSLTVGSVLTVTTGTWSHVPTSYTYQWKRDAANISAATASTYTLVTADIGAMVGCVVTAANAGGSASAASNALGPVIAAPVVGGAVLLAGETDGWATDFTYATDLSRVAKNTSGTTVSSGLSFFTSSGTSSKWVYDVTGTLVNVPAGTLPIEYDPVTHVCRGVLVEPQATNQQGRSNAFDAGWTTSGFTVAQNAAGPLGANTAWTLTCSAGATGKWSYLDFFGGASAHRYSIYAKAGTINWIAIGDGSGGAANAAFFNVSAGTVGTVAGRFSAGAIEAVGNGWYRCSATVTGSLGYIDVQPHSADNQAISWTASGGETVFIFGVQAEPGTVATSYIPTFGATVTRAADQYNVTPASIGHSATAGSWWAEWSVPAVVANGRIIGNTSASAPLLMGTNSVGMLDGTTLSKSLTWAVNTTHKAASAYASGDRAVTLNGAAVAADAGAVTNLLAPGAAIYFGNGGSTPMLGYLRKVRYLPRRPTNAELVTMST